MNEMFNKILYLIIFKFLIFFSKNIFFKFWLLNINTSLIKKLDYLLIYLKLNKEKFLWKNQI
jgi:hypothetical protein